MIGESGVDERTFEEMLAESEEKIKQLDAELKELEKLVPKPAKPRIKFMRKWSE